MNGFQKKNIVKYFDFVVVETYGRTSLHPSNCKSLNHIPDIEVFIQKFTSTEHI
mgnify:CR=1 FL=1